MTEPVRGRLAFTAAAVLGTLHAAPSVYWAAGGRTLLESVGQWAVDAVEERPTQAAAVLAATGAVKLGGAWAPVLAETGHLPGRRVWRGLAWVGGPALVAYGLANVAGGALVLLGWVEQDGADRDGLKGHVLLWGPLFAAWGAALTAGLWRSRER